MISSRAKKGNGEIGRLSVGLAAFLIALSLTMAPAWAAIAKVSQVSGEVIVRSGDRVTRLTSPGILLNDGDQVQVKEGKTEVLFNDGALLRLNAHTNALIQEREEEEGFWIFKRSTAARRITCLVGKLFFQSGTPGKRNYLQTPTAVAGIRGSSGDVGFDNLNSYLNMYVGEAAVVGPMIRGFFQNPGLPAAQRNAVYQALSTALTQAQQAGVSGRPVEIERAKISVLQVVTQIADALQNNPDAVVKADAALARSVSEAAIGEASIKVVVAQLNEEQQKAEQAAAKAQQQGETAKAREAAALAAKIEQERKAAEQLAREAEDQVRLAAAAARQRDLEAAAKAAQESAAKAEKAKQSAGQVITTVPTSLPATTVAPTTAETTAATTVATTVATTTVRPTTSSSSTSTTSVAPSR